MRNNPYPGLWSIFVGEGYTNIAIFLFVIISNLISALLEGVSFAVLMAALSVLTNSETTITKTVLLDHLPFQVSNLSRDNLFLFMIISSVVLQGIRSLIAGIAFYFNSILALKMQREAQIKIYNKIFSFSYPMISQYRVGDLVEHVKTPNAVMNSVVDNFNRMVVSVFMILSVLSVMFFINYKLSLITLAFISIVGFFHKFLILKIAKASQRLSEETLICAKDTTQAFQSIRIVYTNNRQEYLLNIIKNSLERMICFSKKVFCIANFMPSVSELLGILLIISILLSGLAILPHNTEQMVPILLTFLALAHRLAVRLQAFNTTASVLATHKGSILRMEEILSTRDKNWVPNGNKPFQGLHTKIELKNLSLNYSESPAPALKEVSLSVNKGSIVAFIGSSGAGKSSLLDLLLRLYEPTSGSIEVDGIDLRDYEVGSWRDALGVVSQDGFIFNDTIRENVCFGLENKTDQEIKRVLKLSGLGDFVESLPDKQNTVVGERGFRLSGGQRQRLALARALIRNPEILILDEATSNLDSESEQLIQNALEGLRKDRTIIVVAHRLSTVMNADCIYVLKEGIVIEKGNHRDLLAKRGAYFGFWDIQLGTSIRPLAEVVKEIGAR
jgi:ATP-binding cassette subfamily B protein/subfamily B ATP-binding cassette protein MsbA